MRIEKKAWPELFQKVLTKEKRFDLRIADFECRPGDVLVLREWDPVRECYTGRTLEKEITYVMRTKGLEFFSQDDIDEHGFIVMSLE
jgi:hypothetical protein